MTQTSKPAITINTDNCYEQTLGAPGLSPKDLDEWRPKLEAIHKTVEQKTKNGLNSEFASLNLGTEMLREVDAIEAMAKDLRRYKNIILIGIGGSSLGTKAVCYALKDQAGGGPNLQFAENIDPLQTKYLLTKLDPVQTALICISKSGGTMETVVQYLILNEWLVRELGAKEAKQHQCFITDPEIGWLRQLAKKEDISSLPVPPEVGGRYSVLTAVGLLPLAVNNIDITDLLNGAVAMSERCKSGDPDNNPALHLAWVYYLLHTQKQKRISIMMPYASQLKTFVDWYCQLWAESLGKHTGGNNDNPAGSLPVRAIGAVDQHSQLQMYLESHLDKMFTFIELDWRDHKLPIPLDASNLDIFPHLKNKTLADIIHAEFCATRDVITETGHPNLSISMPVLSAHTLGQLIDLYQRTTIYAGLLYGINPLDQPAVEKGKLLAVQQLLSSSTL